MKTFKITYENGQSGMTEMNGTIEEVRRYLIGKSFNFGDTEEHPNDIMIKVIRVEEVPYHATH